MRTAMRLAWIGLALAGGNGSNLIGPSNQLQVTNATDDFQLQVTSLANVTQTLVTGGPIPETAPA